MKEYRNILIGLGLVVLALGITYYLYTVERGHRLGIKEANRRSLDVESSVLEGRSTGEIEIKLYFYRPEAIAHRGSDPFFLEEHSIFETQDVVLNARQIVNEVIKGPEDDTARVLPVEARLRQVYLSEDGTVVVDFARETSEQLVNGGGVTSELAALYSITRSLIENLSEIKRVRFLVEGQERPTFAGHVSIREPFM